MKSSLKWEVSLIHSNLFPGSFCYITQPYKLFTFQYLRYDDSLMNMIFIIFLYIYSLLAFAYWWTAWHISPLIPFSIISSISISVHNSSFTFVFFKATWHANPGAYKNFAVSKWKTFKHIFLKFSKTSAKSNITFKIQIMILT